MLKRQIEKLIRDRGQKGPYPLEPILKGLSHAYGKVAGWNNRRFDHKRKKIRALPCPVISVGNITVGGTGKTPMTVYLARGLMQRGLSPLILSRGYGGSASKNGAVVSDGKTVFLKSSEAGDEPFMMAHELPGVPVVVGRNRFEAAMDVLDRFSPDLILLDDGFQHRTLARDLDMLLFDAAKPLGNGFHLPRGPLREPVMGMARAQLFVLTRSRMISEPEESFIQTLRSLDMPDSVLQTPVVVSDHQPVIRRVIKAGARKGQAPPSLQGADAPHKVFAFSGIAHNQSFRDALPGLGFQVTGFLGFSDHHPYCRRDMDTIIENAQSTPGAILITTDKDASRLTSLLPLPLDLWVVGIDLAILSRENHFWNLVLQKIKTR